MDHETPIKYVMLSIAGSIHSPVEVAGVIMPTGGLPFDLRFHLEDKPTDNETAQFFLVMRVMILTFVSVA